MKKIFFVLILIELFCMSGYAQTSYYKLNRKIENGVPNSNVSGGQFITFMDGVCFESDKDGYSVGHGKLEYKYQNNGIKVYVGDSYWGKSVFKYSQDYSSLNIVVGDDIYVFRKETPPTGVTTCSLIRNKSTNWIPNAPIDFEENTQTAIHATKTTSGHYETKTERCIDCQGRGYNNKTIWHGGDKTSTIQVRCSFCHGKGTIERREYIIDYE